MGHSMATLQQATAGVEAGARLITHLFNAMPAFHHRDPGLIGLLGVHTRPHYSIICDGVHCHPSSVKIAHGSHPAGLILITDAMPAMGLGDGLHTLGDLQVRVNGDTAELTDSRTLAGAVVSLDECVRKFHQFTECTIPEALEAATHRPAQLLFGNGTLEGTLRTGARANFIFLDESLHVKGTVRNGKVAWSASDLFVEPRSW